MPFQLYNFVGLKKNPNIKTIVREIDKVDDRIYFVREILANNEYVCDVYDGENRITNHYVVTLDDNYEKKNIRATFKIREYYPDTGIFIDNQTVFTSIEAIESDAPNYAIWGVSIVCDADCKALGIDPAAPWPPKAA